MRYDQNDANDIPAAKSLNDEDRTLDAILARFDDLMSHVGEVPAGGSHLLDWQ